MAVPRADGITSQQLAAAGALSHPGVDAPRIKYPRSWGLVQPAAGHGDSCLSTPFPPSRPMAVGGDSGLANVYRSRTPRHLLNLLRTCGLVCVPIQCYRPYPGSWLYSSPPTIFNQSVIFTICSTTHLEFEGHIYASLWLARLVLLVRFMNPCRQDGHYLINPINPADESYQLARKCDIEGVR